jgi:hypothetical protein
MRIRSVFSHSAQAIAEGALISLLVVGLMAGTAFAAKGSGGKPAGGSTSGFTGPVMVQDQNGNSSPNYMDEITFNVSTTATTKPQVGLRCYQGAAFVEDAYVSYFNSWLSPTYFQLGSSYWNPALDASCTARLFYYDNRAREHVLGTLTFAVAP